MGELAVLLLTSVSLETTRKLSQIQKNKKERAVTYKLDCSIPRRRYEEVFVDIRPINGENLTRMFLPMSDRQVLQSLTTF